jgi:hypothetical protein
VKPFPVTTICGEFAYFHLDGHLVVVPVCLGSNDNRKHVIHWLRAYWPFHVRHGRLVKRFTKQIEGKRAETELHLHKLYADLVYRDIGYEWSDVTSTGNNFLMWSPETIVPVRDPHASATNAEKEHEVDQQIREHQFDGSLNFILKYGAKFLRAQDDTLTPEQLTHLQTEWVKAAERGLAASMDRDAVEFTNFNERRVSTMTAPELAVEHRPENHPDGVVHPRPFHSTKSPDMDGHANTTADTTDDADALFDHRITVRLENDGCGWSYRLKNRDEYRADLQGHWNDPSTEAVLNRHGWVTPVNGHRPTYEGKCGVSH